MGDPVELAVLAAEVRHLAEAVNQARRDQFGRDARLDKLAADIADIQIRLTVIERNPLGKEVQRNEARIDATEAGIKRLEISAWKVIAALGSSGVLGGVAAKLIGLVG